MNYRVHVLKINSAGDLFAGTGEAQTLDGGDFLPGGIFRFNYSSNSWTQINNGITSECATGLAINPINENIFVGTQSEGVFRSTDNGDTWSPVNYGITVSSNYIRVKCVTINFLGHIFIGIGFPSEMDLDGDGVFCSTDNGDTWKRVNYGATDQYSKAVVALVANSSGDVFVGTYGRGIFKIPVGSY